MSLLGQVQAENLEGGGGSIALWTQVSQVSWEEWWWWRWWCSTPTSISGYWSISETVQLGDPSPKKKKYSPENLKQHALSSALSVAWRETKTKYKLFCFFTARISESDTVGRRVLEQHFTQCFESLIATSSVGYNLSPVFGPHLFTFWHH